MSRSIAVRVALLATALLPAGLAAAQGAAPRAEVRPLPADPAPAPPAPADLSAHPGTASSRTALPSVPIEPVPPGLEARPEGAWRLRFPENAETPPKLAGPGLREIGQRLAARPEGRVTVIAQASGPANDVSTARRLSLARALAVKEALVAAGFPATRIDLRPEGRTEEATDAVDVLPPATRPAAR